MSHRTCVGLTPPHVPHKPSDRPATDGLLSPHAPSSPVSTPTYHPTTRTFVTRINTDTPPHHTYLPHPCRRRRTTLPSTPSHKSYHRRPQNRTPRKHKPHPFQRLVLTGLVWRTMTNNWRTTHGLCLRVQFLDRTLTYPSCSGRSYSPLLVPAPLLSLSFP